MFTCSAILHICAKWHPVSIPQELDLKALFEVISHEFNL
jgi:hypothetical protein